MLFDVWWRCNFRHWLRTMSRQHLFSWFLDWSGRKCALLVGRLMISKRPMMIQWSWQWIRDVDEDQWISSSKNQILGKSQRPNNLKLAFGRNPATMGFFIPFWSPFSIIFWAFLILFSSVFFLTFFLVYLASFTWRKLDEKLCKSEYKVSHFLEKPKTLSSIYRLKPN